MRWHDEIEKTFGVDANIRADAIANMEVTGRTKSYENSPANDFKEEDEGNSNGYNGKHNKYTDKEYQETVYNLMMEVKEVLNAKQILQMLSWPS
jgi:hypothetical protein